MIEAFVKQQIQNGALVKYAFETTTDDKELNEAINDKGQLSPELITRWLTNDKSIQIKKPPSPTPTATSLALFVSQQLALGQVVREFAKHTRTKKMMDIYNALHQTGTLTVEFMQEIKKNAGGDDDEGDDEGDEDDDNAEESGDGGDDDEGDKDNNNSEESGDGDGGTDNLTLDDDQFQQLLTAINEYNEYLGKDGELQSFLTHQFEELGSQKSEDTDEIKELDDSAIIKEFEAALTKLSDTNIQLTTDISIMQQANQQLQEDAQEFRALKEKDSGEIDKLNKANAALGFHLQTFGEQNAELQDENQKLQILIENFTGGEGAVRQKLMSIEGQLQQQQLQTKLQSDFEANKKQLQAEFEAKEKEIEALQAELKTKDAQLTTSNNQFEKEKTNSEQISADYVILMNDFQQLNAKNTELQSDLAVINQHNNELQQKIDKLEQATNAINEVVTPKKGTAKLKPQRGREHLNRKAKNIRQPP